MTPIVSHHTAPTHDVPYMGCFDCQFPEKISTIALSILTTLFLFIAAPPLMAFIYSAVAVGLIITLRWAFFSTSPTAHDIRHCCLVRSSSPLPGTPQIATQALFITTDKPRQSNTPPPAVLIVQTARPTAFSTVPLSTTSAIPYPRRALVQSGKPSKELPGNPSTTSCPNTFPLPKRAALQPTQQPMRAVVGSHSLHHK